MNNNLARLFHRFITEVAPKRQPINPDPTTWPPSWKNVSFKEYPRVEEILLSTEVHFDCPSLESVLQKRNTTNVGKGEPLTKEEISQLLLLSSGVNTKRTDADDPQSRRFYPSGGALYPLEIYVLISYGSDIPPGIYHYNVHHHSLEKIPCEFSLEEIKNCILSDAKNAPVTFMLSAQWDRTFQKYGDFGYQLVLLEAGHLTQNFQLVAEALGLSYCSYMSFDREKLEKILELDEAEEESVLYLTSFTK